MLGNVEAGGTGHNVIIARAHSSFSRVSAVAVAMIASLCAAARWRQGIEPLRSRSCVVFGEIPHLTLLLKTVEGQRNMRHVLYAAHPIPSMTRTYQTAAAAMASSSQGAPPVAARASTPGGLSLTVATFNIGANADHMAGACRQQKLHGVECRRSSRRASPRTKTCVATRRCVWDSSVGRLRLRPNREKPCILGHRPGTQGRCAGRIDSCSHRAPPNLR